MAKRTKAHKRAKASIRTKKPAGKKSGKNAYFFGGLQKKSISEVLANSPAAVFMTKTRSSDARLKQDIQPLKDSLNCILKLNGVSYSWKKETAQTEKREVGFLAQEVERIIPELIEFNQESKDVLGIKYDQMTAVLVEAVKELAKKVAILEDQQKAYLSQLAAVKTN